MSHWLVIYDIRNSKRLRRVAKVTENFGLRVQKSVFELECSRQEIDRLRQILLKIIEEEDYIVYFNICEADWQKREKYGKGRYDEEPNADYYIY